MARSRRQRPRWAVGAVPRPDLPGAHAARRRPWSPVPLCVGSVAQPGGRRPRSTRRPQTLRPGEGPEHVAQMAPDRRHRSFRAARGGHRRPPRPAVSRHGGAGAPRFPRHPQCRPFRCARRGRRPPLGGRVRAAAAPVRPCHPPRGGCIDDRRGARPPDRRIRSRPVGGLCRSNAPRSDLVQRDRRHRTPGSALARVEGRCRPATAARRRTGRHFRRDPSW